MASTLGNCVSPRWSLRFRSHSRLVGRLPDLAAKPSLNVLPPEIIRGSTDDKPRPESISTMVPGCRTAATWDGNPGVDLEAVHHAKGINFVAAAHRRPARSAPSRRTSPTNDAGEIGSTGAPCGSSRLLKRSLEVAMLNIDFNVRLRDAQKIRHNRTFGFEIARHRPIFESF